MSNKSDFYIGGDDKAPPAFARPVRWVVIGLFVLIPALAALLVWQQRGFSTATFDYGHLTTIEGQLVREPVPFLRVALPSRTGESLTHERFLLVGLGKHGADSTIAGWEHKHGALSGKGLKIRGTLIEYRGMKAFELTEEVDALLSVSIPTNLPQIPMPTRLGTVSLRGEITDPKCFLGVMKPGDGRPHRSCAVRCIAGGIPPLLNVAAGAGQRKGYVLAGADGEPINSQLLGYIGKDVQVRGRLEQADNWLILYIGEPVQVMRHHPEADMAIALCH